MKEKKIHYRIIQNIFKLMMNYLYSIIRISFKKNEK